MSSLQLENIAVVLDQALFSIAAEIVWKHLDMFEKVALMMGNFHTFCNFVSSIGKLFGDTGLHDMAVASGVIAEGSISKVCHESLNASMTDESCKEILDLFVTYQDVLRQGRGELAQFWMTYIDMVEILLGLLRADREGDRNLHLASIRQIIPWCFALDKINYARYLPLYYVQMTKLESTCPELYQHFQRGYFSVQLKQGNPFNRISVDQTTEETVNKDTQTAGGTR